jgi:hypothetical protein
MVMDEFLHIPTAAQIDDWELYTGMMENAIRSREGPAVYHQWKFAEQQKEKDRMEWHRQQDQHAKFLDTVDQVEKETNTPEWDFGEEND